jgi:hypothetical protein
MQYRRTELHWRVARMADDRILLTNGALPQNGLGTTGGPIGFQLVRRDGKWDKENRTLLELCTRYRPAKI